MKQGSKSFCVAGNYGKGKILVFGHGLLYSLADNQEGSHKKFLQNAIKWMVGDKTHILTGQLYQIGGWAEFNWDYLDIKLSRKKIEKPEEFNNLDVICGCYYSNWPSTLNQTAI